MSQIDFVSMHRFNGQMGELCQQCQGRCEKTEITMFLPGEVTYAAEKMGYLDTGEFIARFCTIVQYKGHKIYLLKVGTCPFLVEHRCVMEGFNNKPFRCLVYPLAVTIKGDKPVVERDDILCPMARKISPEFFDGAVKTCWKIMDQIPHWWLEFVAKYDDCDYDYTKFEEFRDRAEITLQELASCQIR